MALKAASKVARGTRSIFSPSSLTAASSLKAPCAPWKATRGLPSVLVTAFIVLPFTGVSSLRRRKGAVAAGWTRRRSLCKSWRPPCRRAGRRSGSSCAPEWGVREPARAEPGLGDFPSPIRDVHRDLPPEPGLTKTGNKKGRVLVGRFAAGDQTCGL